LADGSFIPAAFQLKSGPTRLKTNTYIHVWMYRIRLPYFRNLLLQFFSLVCLAILLIICFAFADISMLQKLDQLLLSVLLLPAGRLFIHYYIFLIRLKPIPKINLAYRMLVVLWLCFCSYTNNDHPIRRMEKENTEKAKIISEHLKVGLLI
jgi:predicted neutral ceramidase superfamily lipid hydrolase